LANAINPVGRDICVQKQLNFAHKFAKNGGLQTQILYFGNLLSMSIRAESFPVLGSKTKKLILYKKQLKLSVDSDSKIQDRVTLSTG